MRRNSREPTNDGIELRALWRSDERCIAGEVSCRGHQHGAALFVQLVDDTALFYVATEADLSGQSSSYAHKSLASCDVSRRKDAGKFASTRNAFEATVLERKDEMA